MQFSPSPRGHHLLAYNSSRIYVIDVRGASINMKRELKILRRPVSTCVKDDGTLLAVLSSEMQVDLYDLEVSPPRRKQSIILDNTPRTIALSPCGSVLAAAYEGGIEVSSLNAGALSTDRRAVKCDAVDALSFSFDGTQILGTTIHSNPPTTVILTAPYYDPGSHLSDDNLSAMWTTSILFPNTSRDCSHAVLLQDGSQDEASWTFTYDRSFETFRAVRIDDLRNGTTYFTGPTPQKASQGKLLPSTLPSATYNGELVCAGFQGKDVWVYGVPQDLDAVPELPPQNEAGSISGRSSSSQGVTRRSSTRGQDANGAPVPQWQLLCDQLRNTFVAGTKVSEVTGVKSVKWVADFGDASSKERLVIGARGVVGPMLVTEEEDMDFVDGGRITLLDFDYGLTNGSKSEVTIEVGTDEAEVLEEEQRDLETEVAIVRRRTVAQKRGGRTALLRSATTSASRVPEILPLPQNDNTDDDPLLPRRIGQNPVSRRAANESVDDGDTASIDEMELLDAPYAHASPRSGTTLRRAATAAAVNRTLNPRTADGRPIEYRRADGRREHPHESDADNWVPPPPPYQKDDPGDMPAFLRGPAVAPSAPPVPPLPSLNMFSHGHFPRSVPGAAEAQRSPEPFHVRPSHQRTASDSTTMSRPRAADNETPRPMSSPSAHADFENLYDVSPPASPRTPAVEPTEPTEPIEPQPAQDRPVTPAQEPLPPREISPPEASPPAASVSVQSTPEKPTTQAEAEVEESVPTPSSRADAQPEPIVEARPNVPMLDIDIPQTQLSFAQPENETSPAARQLSNSQTWPAAPRPEADPTTGPSGYPYSAPPSQGPLNDFSEALPPLPTSNQLASLNKRMSQGNPRRLSGGFQGAVYHARAGSRSAEQRWSQYHSTPDLMESLSNVQEFDQPLIISTPTGVSGAYDPPDRQTSTRRSETPLLAPVPRHPRPTQGSSTRPTVERLETIYSYTGQAELAPPQAPPSQSGPRSMLAWMRASSAASNRGSGVHRRPSRAERSAAKNMQDARQKAWDAKTRKNKKKKNKNKDGGSTTGWTDVSTGSAMKDKKCVVM